MVISLGGTSWILFGVCIYRIQHELLTNTTFQSIQPFLWVDMFMINRLNSRPQILGIDIHQAYANIR